MKRLTREQQRVVVQQWKKAGPELERVRNEELRKWVYDWTSVDALLELGDRFGQSREATGMVEMQRLFIKAARQQGLLPAMVRETPAPYGSAEPGPRKPMKTRRKKRAHAKGTTGTEAK